MSSKSSAMCCAGGVPSGLAFWVRIRWEQALLHFLLQHNCPSPSPPPPSAAGSCRNPSALLITQRFCFHSFWSSFLFSQVRTSWPTQQEGGFSLCLKKKKCPRVCRDDLQFSPAEADRMRLWAVPPPSMLPLFKMKRKPRKGRTTRTEMCLAVSAIELRSWPGDPGLSLSREWIFVALLVLHLLGAAGKGLMRYG